LLAAVLGIDQGTFIPNNSQIIGRENGLLITSASLSLEIFVFTLLVSALVGALLGVIVAYPTRRLRADYLGMVLLAAGQVILVLGNNYPPLVGGTQGVSVPDPFQWAGSFTFAGLTPGDVRNIMAVAFMVIVAVIIFLYARRLTHSPLGRMLRAVRDDEDSVLALGKDVERTRFKVIVFASAMAAVAGALYAFYSANVFYSTFNRTGWTFWPWVMVILGGAANDWGVVAGTFIFVAVRQTITFYRDFFAPFLPFDVVWLDTLLLGLALLIILIYRPDGLIREKPIKTIKNAKPPSTGTGEAAPPESESERQEQPKSGLEASLRSLFKSKKKSNPEKG
jgi:branched-chain amino acid transport system permease protein